MSLNRGEIFISHLLFPEAFQKDSVLLWNTGKCCGYAKAAHASSLHHLKIKLGQP